METVGLFLFNDALVVTTQTNSHVPYERCVEHVYTFDTCAVLARLRLDDISDSKCAYTELLTTQAWQRHPQGGSPGTVLPAGCLAEPPVRGSG